MLNIGPVLQVETGKIKQITTIYLDEDLMSVYNVVCYVSL